VKNLDVAALFITFLAFIFIGVPIAYSLGLSSLIYIFFFTEVPIIIVAQQILKGVDSFTLMAIPFFVISGALMEKGGISERIVDFVKSLVGKIPGGQAVVTVTSSMIFASMTGAGAATTAAVGGIMIPSMIDEGYDPGYASAVQAVGGVFGPIIPPSILMVLYAIAAGTSVGDMLLSGIIPGIFLGCIMIVIVIIQCKKKGYGGSQPFDIKKVLSSFKFAIWALLVPVIILGGIYSGFVTPTEASAVASFYCLIIGLFVYKGLKFKTLAKTVFSGLKTACGIMAIVGASQIFGWVLTREGIPQMIATWSVNNIHNQTMFMLDVCLILFFTGMFIDAVPSMLIMAPLLCPAVEMYGIDMVHFGVVMVIMICIGLATPPVGLNLFVASSVGGVPVHKIIPHLMALIVALVVGAIILVFLPQLSVWLPYLLK
jgi:C4-dicarboxylate transporter DctM subunit